MQFEISDEAAIVFAGGFYESLTAGMPVDASLGAARLAMLAERSDDIEWGTPVLFMRVPDGRIFDLGDGRGGVPGLDNPAADPQLLERGAALSHDVQRVFINHRRDDAGHALLLADRLRRYLGSESVHFAPEAGSELDRLAQVQASDVFLALIGPTWVSSLRGAGANGRGEDWVRREIEWALRDLPDRVIPVNLDATVPDPASLPRSLRGLFRTQPAELRHASFDEDLPGLVGRIGRVAGRSEAPATTRARRDAADAAERPVIVVSPPENGGRRAAGIPAPYEAHYAEVIEGMLDGSVVPLLGTGAHAERPEADQLAAPLADRFQMGVAGLAEIAQRVAVTLGERRLYTAMKDLIAAQSQPTDVHRFLAAFPGLLRKHGLSARHQLIITANYDMALERAFEEANEPFDYAVYLAGGGWFVHVPWGEHASEPIATTILEPKRYVGFPIDDDGQLERTIIVKIHGGADGREGDVTWRNNYVVTEDQFIDYLPTHNIQDHLPIQILDKLTGSRCLFLGYPLRDWNSRVFLRRIWRGQPISESSWAIEPHPDPLEKASWSVIGHVELLDAPLPEYVRALRSSLADDDGH